MNILKSIFTVILLSTVITSCTQTKTNNKTSNSQKPNDIELFKRSVKTIRPNVRNIEDVSALLYLSGTDYIDGLVNDPHIWESYNENDVSFAANMGVYIVDGLYLAAFNEKKNGYMSFMAGKSIAAELGVTDIFEEITIKRLNNGSTPDSKSIERFNDLLYSSEKVFNDKDANQLFTALLSGSYIEKQFLLFNTIFNIPDNMTEEEKLMLTSRLIVVASEELLQLPELLKIIESYKPSSGELYVYEQLLELEELRAALNLGAAFDKTTPNDFFNNPKLTELHLKINEIRAIMVSGK